MATQDEIRSLYAALVRVLGRSEAATLFELLSPPNWRDIVDSYPGGAENAPSSGLGDQG